MVHYFRESMKKKIIGIDPGTNVTGWGVILFCGNLYQYVSCGVIRSPLNVRIEKKYLYLFEKLSSILETYTPTVLSVESQFMDKNVQSAIKLGMSKTVAYLAAAKSEIPVFEYAPRKAKQAVTGRGNATKEAVAKMLEALLGLKKGLPEDATDALSIAIAHAHFSKRIYV